MEYNLINSAKRGNQYLSFELADHTYAIDVRQVAEIRNYESPTPVPESPECLRGVINIRGVLVPILDLRERLGYSKKCYDNFTVVIVVRLSDSKQDLVGLIVDEVSDVFDITNTELKPIPKTIVQEHDKYLDNLVLLSGTTIIILNCNELINDKERLMEICQNI